MEALHGSTDLGAGSDFLLPPHKDWQCVGDVQLLAQVSHFGVVSFQLAFLVEVIELQLAFNDEVIELLGLDFFGLQHQSGCL